MTDYLLELLSAAEEEEDGAVQWAPPVILGLERGYPARREAAEERRADRAAGRAGEEDLPRVPGADMPEREEAAERSDRYGARSVGEDGGLYRRMVRLRQAADRAESDRERQSVRTAAPADLGTTALTAEGLDRAIQRDARRYDGGFDLL